MLRARVTAVVFAVLALAAIVAAARSPRAEAQPSTIRTSGGMVSNSKNGSAILSGNLGPGDSLSGTVTIGNIGNEAGVFTLSASHLLDSPGPGGGSFAGRLLLTVDDVTNPAAPVRVYLGPLGALPSTALGSFDRFATRTYLFTVSWPDGGAADSAFTGSALSVEFDWSTGDGGGGGDQSSPPPSTGDGGGGPPSDRQSPPNLRFSTAKKQRVLRHHWLAAKANCDQACRLTVTAKLSVKGVRRAVKLHPMRRTLTAGHATRLKIKLPKAVLRKVRSALRAHRKTVVTLTVTAAGGAGRAAPVRRSVRLVG
jgi:hypothetical protein